MRFALLFILLGFPAVETYFLFVLAQEIGWWLAVWIIVAALAGTLLVREAGVAMPNRLLAALKQGSSLLSGLFDSGRTVLAGLLLIFPGVVSDVIALFLLLLPARADFHPHPGVQTNGVIEGEFRRESDRQNLR